MAIIMNIAVITGGLSTERDVAISSGGKIAAALRSKGHNVVLIDVYMGYDGEIDPKHLFENNADLLQAKGVGESVPDLKAVRESRRGDSPCFLGRKTVSSRRRLIYSE